MIIYGHEVVYMKIYDFLTKIPKYMQCMKYDLWEACSFLVSETSGQLPLREDSRRQRLREELLFILKMIYTYF